MLYQNRSSKLCIFRSNQTIAGRHSAYCSSLINSRTEKRNFEYNCIDLTLNTFLLTIEEGKEVLFCQSSFDYTSYLYKRVQYCRQQPEMKYFLFQPHILSGSEWQHLDNIDSYEEVLLQIPHQHISCKSGHC